MLQCVALRCSVLQRWSSSGRILAAYELQCVAVFCSVLQHVALCYIVLQCAATSEQFIVYAGYM